MAKGSAAGARGREAAARDCVGILDARLFRALCEPVRLQIVRLLLTRGRSDLGALAAELPQDASVVSRHLSLLHAAGVVTREKEGRHVFHAIDGPAVIRRFREIVAQLERAVPLCCPGPARPERSNG